ncbi:hypothetical protein OCU04_006719 [Sclerotinia nivalis]|uniref:Uncharacterized protein n=1 Tax=Sclerotinia nivalis TaxID=352851 RepID=A0A9X0AKG2_9HELO|nr:hypothetical protein OCU04_006719 [Sclerotinia nivalis]
MIDRYYAFPPLKKLRLNDAAMQCRVKMRQNGFVESREIKLQEFIPLPISPARLALPCLNAHWLKCEKLPDFGNRIVWCGVYGVKISLVFPVLEFVPSFHILGSN